MLWCSFAKMLVAWRRTTRCSKNKVRPAELQRLHLHLAERIQLSGQPHLLHALATRPFEFWLVSVISRFCEQSEVSAQASPCKLSWSSWSRLLKEIRRSRRTCSLSLQYLCLIGRSRSGQGVVDSMPGARSPIHKPQDRRLKP